MRLKRKRLKMAAFFPIFSETVSAQRQRSVKKLNSAIYLWLLLEYFGELLQNFVASAKYLTRKSKQLLMIVLNVA